MQATLETDSGYLDVPAKIEELPWQKLGLQETATGYGSALTTRYMVKYRNRWRRVYCCQFANSGTLYLSNEDAIVFDIQH